MRTEFKHNPQVPYSLHDMRMNGIKIADDKILLGFENGYEEAAEPYRRVDGKIIIEGVDFDGSGRDFNFCVKRGFKSKKDGVIFIGWRGRRPDFHIPCR